MVERAVVSGTDDLRKQVAELARSVRELEIQALSARVSGLGQDIVRVRQQLRYLSLAAMGHELALDPLDLTPYEMSFFSQNGEDGVLVEVLRRVGAGTRRFIEIGASHAGSQLSVPRRRPGLAGLVRRSRPQRGGVAEAQVHR